MKANLDRFVEWVVNGKTITERRQTDQKENALAAVIWSFRSEDYPIEAVRVNGVDYPRLGVPR